MKESYTGIGMDKKHCSSKKRKFEKRAINKFRRKQLKLDEIIKCNRFGKYWA